MAEWSNEGSFIKVQSRAENWRDKVAPNAVARRSVELVFPRQMSKICFETPPNVTAIIEPLGWSQPSSKLNLAPQGDSPVASTEV